MVSTVIAKFHYTDTDTDFFAAKLRWVRAGPFGSAGPILSVFPALIVHSELKSVHPGFPVAFIFKHKLINN